MPFSLKKSKHTITANWFPDSQHPGTSSTLPASCLPPPYPSSPRWNASVRSAPPRNASLSSLPYPSANADLAPQDLPLKPVAPAATPRPQTTLNRSTSVSDRYSSGHAGGRFHALRALRKRRRPTVNCCYTGWESWARALTLAHQTISANPHHSSPAG